MKKLATSGRVKKLATSGRVKKLATSGRVKKLAAYASKRDFTVTSEPAGGVPLSWRQDVEWLVTEGAPWLGRRARDLGPWAVRMAWEETRRNHSSCPKAAGASRPPSRESSPRGSRWVGRADG